MENITEDPFILINLAFWKYQAIMTAFSDRNSNSCLHSTLPVLNTHGHFGMSCVDKCLYKSQCPHIWRWIVFNIYRPTIVKVFFSVCLDLFLMIKVFTIVTKYMKANCETPLINVKNFSIISYLTD